MKFSYTDGAITIRPWKNSDVDDLFEAATESIEVVYPWLPWCHPNYSIEESRGWVSSRSQAWENGDEYNFAILDTNTHRFIGGIGINQISRLHNFANMGYWVRLTAQNHGVATQASILAARFGFDELNLERIEILAAVDNLASQRVAEKTGAVREGVLRHRLKIGKTYQDAVIFSLIKSEFPANYPD